VLGPFTGAAAPYRDRIADRINGYAATSIIKAGGVEKRCLEWFKLMVRDHLTLLAAKRDGFQGPPGQNPLSRNGKLPTDRELYERFVEKGFQDMRLMAGGQFVYTLHFRQVVGGQLPVIKLGVHAYNVTISKDIVSGKVRTPDQAWLTRSDDKKVLRGVYATGGVKLGFDLVDLTGVKPEGGAASTSPGTAELESFVDLTFADFDDADFSIAAVNPPSVNTPLGAFGRLSSIFQLELQNGVRMSQIVEGSFLNFKLPKQVPNKTLSVTLFEVSAGFGRLTSKQVSPPPPPKDSSTSVLTPTDVSVRNTTFVRFDK